MQVLQAFTSYLSNSENWAYRMITNLPSEVKNVITAEVFVNNNFDHPSFEYVKFPLKRMEGQNAKPLFNYLTFKVINQIRKLYPLYILNCAKQVDLIHSHYAFTGWKFQKIANKLNVPHIVSFYGWDYEKFPELNPGWYDRYKELFILADAFICEGTFAGKVLQKIGCPEEKIRVIRLGVEPSSIPFFTRYKKEGELHLLQIATFTEKKGYIYTIKAFAKALQTCPNMSLTLVGGGSATIKQELLEVVAQNRMEEKVNLLEAVDFRQLHHFMANYQVFIHPSCYASSKDSEGGAPIVLLDAQATGMPVIATTHCDIPDEVLDGISGKLTPEKEVAPLADNIRYFYHLDNARYQQYAAEARKHVVNQYDVKKNAVLLFNLYAELTNK